MNVRPDRSRGLSPREAAAHWFAREQRGSLSPAEADEFQRWLEHPLHAEALADARRAWDAFDGAVDDPHVQALRRAALAVRPERRGLRALAASVAVLLSATFLAAAWHQWHAQSPRPPSSVVAAANPSAATYTTGAHERRDVRLPDGTQVAINTATTLEVAFSATERLVTLKTGQAYFDVAHDAAHPFIVQTPHRRVTALGTAFDVESASGLFQVTLVQGSVRVDNAPDALAAAAAAPTQVVLAPGQALVARLGVEEQVLRVDVERRLRWRQGFIEFDDEPLGQAVAEMGRYFTQPVVIRDPRVAQLRVSGVFRTTANDEFLSIVGELLPVDVTHRPDGSTELLWRDRPSSANPK